MNPKNLYLINMILVFIYKITTIIIGYFIIKLGYKLIRDGIKGKFKLSASYSGLKADLYSASPGILFIVLGVFLISIAIFSNKNLNYIEKSPKIEKFNPILNLPIDTLKKD